MPETRKTIPKSPDGYIYPDGSGPHRNPPTDHDALFPFMGEVVLHILAAQNEILIQILAALKDLKAIRTMVSSIDDRIPNDL